MSRILEESEFESAVTAVLLAWVDVGENVLAENNDSTVDSLINRLPRYCDHQSIGYRQR